MIHTKWTPPHPPMGECNADCNNTPPAHGTWDAYEQALRFRVLQNRLDEARARNNALVFKLVL